MIVYNIGMSASPRDRQSERAYQAIRDEIVAGRIQPGDRLVETELAARCGVSRTPVRQALEWLSREGVVELTKRRGARLRSLSPEQVADLYALRAQLEAFACQLAADRAGAADHEALEASVAAFDRAASSGDLDAIAETNAALHRRIATSARNPFLEMALDTVIENPLVTRTFARFGAEELQRSALFHRLIVEAIVRGDGERAGRLMSEHVLQASDTLASVDADEAAA